MDQATADFIKEKLKPHIDEVFDGYVLVGYARHADGTRKRLCIFNDGVRDDGSCDDAAVADGIRPLVVVARTWGMGQS